jgi:hypothetical protein
MIEAVPAFSLRAQGQIYLYFDGIIIEWLRKTMHRVSFQLSSFVAVP